MIEQPRPAFKQRTVHGKRVAFSRDEEGSPARAILLGQCYSLCGFPGQGFDDVVPSVRVSLANLTDFEYRAIGAATRRILDDYHQMYTEADPGQV